MKNSNRVLFVKQIADWQPIAIEEDEKLGYNQGIYVSGDFVNLDMFVRYGTPWIGDAPTFYAQGGEVIGISGVSIANHYEYFIEVNDETQEIRTWKAVG